jgi:hypothetical protein
MASDPHLIMAVGNGEMWVIDDGQDIEIGDHLISSDLAGHAIRDAGEFPVSHIIGLAVEAVNWDEGEESVDGRKHRRISILFERFTVNHAVQQTAENSSLGLNHADLDPTFVSAFQEQQKIIGRQRQQLEKHESENAAMRVRMDELNQKFDLLVTSIAANKTATLGAMVGVTEVAQLTH